MEEMIESLDHLHDESLYDFYSSPDIVRVMKLGGWGGPTASTEGEKEMHAGL